MDSKTLLNPIFSLAARVCERSKIACSFIRSVPFRGKGLVVQRIRPNCMPRDVVASCNGIRFGLDLRDDVQREMYFNVYEKDDLQLALDLIPEGGTCIDVGANNGAFALHFARKVGNGGTVHAFEPDPLIFSRLQRNVALNGFERVLHCHQQAVSNVCGSLSFHRSNPEHSGWGSLVEFKDIAVKTEQVATTTLDSVLDEQNLETIDLLKVDVEAHEPELLQGARRSLARQAFRSILIEFNGIRLAERGEYLDSFLKPLTSAGYAPAHMRVEIMSKMREGLIAPETVCTNFFFTPTEISS